MKHYYVTYNDGDDCSTVHVYATCTSDAADQVMREYHDCESIISIKEVN